MAAKVVVHAADALVVAAVAEAAAAAAAALRALPAVGVAAALEKPKRT